LGTYLGKKSEKGEEEEEEELGLKPRQEAQETGTQDDR